MKEPVAGVGVDGNGQRLFNWLNLVVKEVEEEVELVEVKWAIGCVGSIGNGCEIGGRVAKLRSKCKRSDVANA